LLHFVVMVFCVIAFLQFTMIFLLRKIIVFSFFAQCHWFKQMVIKLFFLFAFGFMLERSRVFFSCCMKFGDQRTHIIEEDWNMKIMCLEVIAIFKFVVVFCCGGLFCYWVFASHNDFFGGKESLCCLFLCGVIGYEICWPTKWRNGNNGKEYIERKVEGLGALNFLFINQW
jgi:hypothetical protein